MKPIFKTAAAAFALSGATLLTTACATTDNTPLTRPQVIALNDQHCPSALQDFDAGRKIIPCPTMGPGWYETLPLHPDAPSLP